MIGEFSVNTVTASSYCQVIPRMKVMAVKNYILPDVVAALSVS